MQMLIIKLTKENDAQDKGDSDLQGFKVSKVLAKPRGGLKSMKAGPPHLMDDLAAAADSTSGISPSFLDS